MSIPLYQVDAFSDRPFGGNPAAVHLGAQRLHPGLVSRPIEQARVAGAWIGSAVLLPNR